MNRGQPIKLSAHKNNTGNTFSLIDGSLNGTMKGNRNNHVISQSTSKNQHNSSQNNYSASSRILQLQLELKEAFSHIDVLKENNKELMDKVSFYERKFQDMRHLEEELVFRRQQEKSMQAYLDNYQLINQKLRQKIFQMEIQFQKQTEFAKLSHLSTHEVSNSESSVLQKSMKLQKNLYLQGSKAWSARKSTGEVFESNANNSSFNKQNHHLTPKTRVSIDYTKYMAKNQLQLDPFNKIKERRKVFM